MKIFTAIGKWLLRRAVVEELIDELAIFFKPISENLSKRMTSLFVVHDDDLLLPLLSRLHLRLLITEIRPIILEQQVRQLYCLHNSQLLL
jgi:hypothetical protein